MARYASRQQVEQRHGRNSVAALPSGRAVERIETPWGVSVLVLRNPKREDMRRLVARDGYATIRVWMSPDGNDAFAWTAGDVTHFQLYGDLEDHGWRQCHFHTDRGALPVFSVHDDAADILMAGKVARRMAGGPFLVHTALRTMSSEDPPVPADSSDACGGPAPRP